jgi:hypothetical protein
MKNNTISAAPAPIARSSTVSAVLLHHRLAKSRFTGYDRHSASVIQFVADGWTSRRYVVSGGGSRSTDIGPLSDMHEINSAIRIASFMLADGAFGGHHINEAIELVLTNNITGAEVNNLLEESYDLEA